MWKKFVSLNLALLLVLTLLPATALAASADTVDEVKYVEGGDVKTANNATVITSSSTTWNSGWYVVNGNVTISDSVTVNGTVNLILADGCTLTAAQGIRVDAGNNGNSHNYLNIYGQSSGSGTLIATGGDNSAGIGGVGYEVTSCNLTLYGGTVMATGGNDYPGIGCKISGYDAITIEYIHVTTDKDENNPLEWGAI